MIFTVDRGVLFQALHRVQSVVEKRNALQILSHVLCVIQDQSLNLSATDIEVGMRVQVPVRNATEGKVTLSAKSFLDIVKELPEAPITIQKKENNWVEIVCGKSKFTIVGLSADEYPALPAFEEKTYFEAKREAVLMMIDRTQFAVSTDATRYHMNGVFFESLESGLMRMTATDGHRLSFVDQEVFLNNPEIKRGMIIPKKGLSELKNLIGTTSGLVHLAFEKGYVFAKVDESFLFVRLIDGEYPPYSQVIPKQVDKKILLNRESFTSALKRVSLLAHEKSKAVKLAFSPQILTISSSNPDLGEAREEIDVQYAGESLEVGFNSKYLLDFLSISQADSLEFLLKDRLSPGILREAGQERHVYVIMPMRI